MKFVRPVSTINFSFSASLNDLKIFIANDDNVSPDLKSKAINGNLVYLCQSKDDDADEILECYGLGTISFSCYFDNTFSYHHYPSGIVRSVDHVNNKVYLLSSISTAELQHVNTLALCSIPLPTSILINQSTKVTGCVPYAYSSDNFIGSKQIVPISYRPDKQTSKQNTKSV